MMKTIRHEIQIAMSADALFDLTQDYTRRLAWDPYLAKAHLLHGASAAGVGVEAACTNHFGMTMVTQYIAYERPRVAAVEMIHGPRLLKRFHGAWNVREITPVHSRLIFTYSFELRGGIVGRLLLPIAARWFSRDMQQRLRALHAYVDAQLR